MKKLFSALLAICMVCMFAVPVFADANDDYIAAVKAYQQEIAAKEQEIAAKQEEITAKQGEIDAQWSAFKGHMAAMQELREGGSVAMLSSVTNLYELLTFNEALRSRIPRS